MPSSAAWWPRRARHLSAHSDRSNPLLLDDGEQGLASPRTPENATPAPSQPVVVLPLPLHLRTLAAAFRGVNVLLTAASLATLATALLLCRAAPGLVPLALAAAAAVASALGCLGTLASPTQPAAVSTYSAAVGGALLTEAVLVVAGLVARHQAQHPPGPDPRLPATHAALLAGGAMVACQVSGSAIASLLLPAATAAEDWQVEANAAAEGWASPPRWGAASVGRAPRPPPTTLTTPPPAADPDGAAFAARMRDRYGLDTGAMAYDPAARSAAWRRESGGGGGGGVRSVVLPPLPPRGSERAEAGEAEGGRACVGM